MDERTLKRGMNSEKVENLTDQVIDLKKENKELVERVQGLEN